MWKMTTQPHLIEPASDFDREVNREIFKLREHPESFKYHLHRSNAM